MASALDVIYDGRRRGRDMVYIEPYNRWGERPYGLLPGHDDYSLPNSPRIGGRYRMVVADPTHRRLVQQRERRSAYRRKPVRF